MKYTARFVFYHYDEFDTTLANIYDILVQANNPAEAFKKAEDVLAEQIKIYSFPGSVDFISLIDENKTIYVLSKRKLVVISEEDYEKLPKKFCDTGETFFVVEKDKNVKIR